jgi:hypothetical protein
MIMLNILKYGDLVLVGHGGSYDVGFFCSLDRFLLLQKPEGHLEGLDLVLIDPLAIDEVVLFDCAGHPEDQGKEWVRC